MVIYIHKATFHKHRTSQPRAPQASHSIFKWTATKKLLSFLNIRKFRFRVFCLGSHRKYRTQGLGADTALAQDPSSFPASMSGGSQLPAALAPGDSVSLAFRGTYVHVYISIHIPFPHTYLKLNKSPG